VNVWLSHQSSTTKIYILPSSATTKTASCPFSLKTKFKFRAFQHSARHFLKNSRRFRLNLHRGSICIILLFKRIFLKKRFYSVAVRNLSIHLPAEMIKLIFFFFKKKGKFSAQRAARWTVKNDPPGFRLQRGSGSVPGSITHSHTDTHTQPFRLLTSRLLPNDAKFQTIIIAAGNMCAGFSSFETANAIYRPEWTTAISGQFRHRFDSLSIPKITLIVTTLRRHLAAAGDNDGRNADRSGPPEEL
jgi:hypothetical protein